MASLETRVERLEKQIAQAKGRKASMNALDMVSGQPLLTPRMPSLAGGGKIRRKEAQDVNDLVSDFGFL